MEKEIIERNGLIIIMLSIALIIIQEIIEVHNTAYDWGIAGCTLVLFGLGYIMYLFPNWLKQNH